MTRSVGTRPDSSIIPGSSVIHPFNFPLNVGFGVASSGPCRPSLLLRRPCLITGFVSLPFRGGSLFDCQLRASTCYFSPTSSQPLPFLFLSPLVGPGCYNCIGCCCCFFRGSASFLRLFCVLSLWSAGTNGCCVLPLRYFYLKCSQGAVHIRLLSLSLGDGPCLPELFLAFLSTASFVMFTRAWALSLLPEDGKGKNSEDNK